MKITVWERSTRRLSPRVRVALSSMPRSNCQRASLAFSISSKSRKESLQLIGMRGRERFLRDQRMSFAMAEIAWGRTDELGNFVRVLKFGAVHLDDETGIAEENFRGGFDDARFARTGRTEEEQIPNGTAGRVEAGAKDLIEVDEGLHTLFLADDLAANGVMEIAGIGATDGGVQLMANGSFHNPILGKTDPFL